MKKFISLLTITVLHLSYYGYASEVSLDDHYNSISGQFTLDAFGDDQSHSISGSAIANLGGDVLVGTTISYSWVTEVDGVDVSSLDLEESQLLFGVGYVIKVSEDFHVVPNIRIGQAEINALGYHVLDADLSQIGVSLRFNRGTNLSSFGLYSVEVDNFELVGGAASYLSSSQQALVENASGNDIALSYQEMYPVGGGGSYFGYGLSTTGLETFSASIILSLNL